LKYCPQEAERNHLGSSEDLHSSMHPEVVTAEAYSLSMDLAKLRHTIAPLIISLKDAELIVNLHQFASP